MKEWVVRVDGPVPVLEVVDPLLLQPLLSVTFALLGSELGSALLLPRVILLRELLLCGLG
jgi:hypothetical protein